MTAREFRAALERLGLTQEAAARRLGVWAGGRPNKARVSHWCTGHRKVPAYIAAHVETLLRD